MGKNGDEHQMVTDAPLLLRLDSGNDSVDNLVVCHDEKTLCDYIIKLVRHTRKFKLRFGCYCPWFNTFAFGPLFCCSTLKTLNYLTISKNSLQGCWLDIPLVGLTPTRISDLARLHYTKFYTLQCRRCLH